MYLLKYLSQVVNDEIKDAFDEFVTKWVEDDLQRRLGPNQDPDNVPEEEMAILMEATGANLRLLVQNLSDIVTHIANPVQHEDLWGLLVKCKECNQQYFEAI